MRDPLRIVSASGAKVAVVGLELSPRARTRALPAAGTRPFDAGRFHALVSRQRATCRAARDNSSSSGDERRGDRPGWRQASPARPAIGGRLGRQRVRSRWPAAERSQVAAVGIRRPRRLVCRLRRPPRPGPAQPRGAPRQIRVRCIGAARDRFSCRAHGSCRVLSPRCPPECKHGSRSLRCDDCAGGAVQQCAGVVEPADRGGCACCRCEAAGCFHLRAHGASRERPGP